MVAERATEQRLADDEGIARAAALLRQGRLVVFPTETVYGLGADARSGAAVADIFAAKGRPRFNPLIAHVATTEQAMEQGRFNRQAQDLAANFWPGPLTLVVPAAATCTVSDLARAGLDSVALRVPDHPIASNLLRAAAIPVAAPSANRSGRISPTTADHARRDLFGRVDLILDGGPTTVGLESTILSCLDEQVTVLRPGGLTRDAVERVLRCSLPDGGGGKGLLAPGMMASHYAPRAAIRLDATHLRTGEAVLDFGNRFASSDDAERLDLSPSADLREAAANLFSFMHRLDTGGATVIAVAPIPRRGLGEAINDRLARAAAPRP